MSTTMAVVETEKKRSGIDFNALIAKMHRLNQQLIGIQLTSGNMIALALSAGQITAGVIALLWPKVGLVALWSILLCFPISIVIERLSLGGLMICRTALKRKEDEEARYQLRVIKLRRSDKEPTESEKYEHERAVKQSMSNVWLAIPIIVLGVGISGMLGDQIWQLVFQSLERWEVITLSICCAVTISLTFVFSELFREMADMGLVDIINDDRIETAVLAHAERGIQIDMTMEAVSNVRKNRKKNEKEVAKIERVISSRVSAFADYVEERGLGTVPGITGPKEVKQIAARSTARGKFADAREDLEWYLQKHSDATCQMVASKFGVTRSTAKTWLDRVRVKEETVSDNDTAIDAEAITIDETTEM